MLAGGGARGTRSIPVWGMLPSLCRNLLASGLSENSNRGMRRRLEFLDRRPFFVRRCRNKIRNADSSTRESFASERFRFARNDNYKRNWVARVNSCPSRFVTKAVGQECPTLRQAQGRLSTRVISRKAKDPRGAQVDRSRRASGRHPSAPLRAGPRHTSCNSRFGRVPRR